jgi:hypothetical protein
LAAGARAHIGCILERFELVLAQIAEIERQRDAVLETETPGQSEQVIRDLVRLSGIGVQSATLLVREALPGPSPMPRPWAPMRASPELSIAAAACTANKGSARPATAACASPW